jgi:hypothetical protein
VTPEVLAEAAGDGTLSLALTSTTYGVTTYRSLEASNPEEWPRLVVTHLTADAIETFAEWQAATYPGATDPAVIGPLADGQGRGVSNIFAYATGWAPGGMASAILEAFLDGDGWVLRWHRDPATDDVRLFAEISADGETWVAAPATPEVTGTDAVGREIIELRLPRDGPRLFARLRALLGDTQAAP